MNSTNDIVMVMGYPAMGKSRLAKPYIEQGYFRLNRDILGCGLDDLIPMMSKEYNNGETRFILDNTYMTKESRTPVIEWAQKNGFSVKGIWLTSKTPKAIEVAQYNSCLRMIRRFGKLLSPDEIKAKKDPNTFPPAALFAYRKKLEKPKKKEGFDTLETVYFEREMDKEIYKNKAIILDYDGTLRKTKSGEKYPKTPDDIEILPGRRETLDSYLERGYLLLGVSNQSFVGKGVITHKEAESCFEKTNELLGLDIDYRFCPHYYFPINCYCRKPMPGLGVELVEEYKLNPDETIMVGDQTTDKTFARRCGFQFQHADKFFKM
ncbi:MAG: HAD-IIIA family hydrolase [Candidatus Lokiarchaeota archaeon]|nr:HAD-IIIA family hydrolase [Candidatus Lokiarchaeota archaeon]